MKKLYEMSVHVSFTRKDAKLTQFGIENSLRELHEVVKKKLENEIQGENERLGD